MACCGNDYQRENLDQLNFNDDTSFRKRKQNIFKIVLLGDSSVGKTSLMRRFVRSDFSTEYKATIGADFLSKELVIDGCNITLQIWDTAGQERFHSLGVVFYRGADACILVCDVSNESTLNSLGQWRNEFGSANSDSNQQNINNSEVDSIAGVPCLLFANKCDLSDELRVVTNQKLDEWRKEHGNMQMFETSALNGLGVDDAFRALAEKLLKLNKSNPN